MAITFTTKAGAASSKASSEQPSDPVKKAPHADPTKRGGRPVGAKNKAKSSRKNQRDVGAFQQSIREGKKAALLADKIQATADMTDDQLLERARTIDDGRGARGGQREEILTEITAERSALAYRLMIRGLSEEQIATQMGINLATVQRYLRSVKGSLNLDPKKLDIGYYMGESLAFYQEIRQMALLAASTGTNSTNTKLQAMRVALESEAAKNIFLQKIGVYSPTVIERIERVVFAESARSFGDEKEVRPRVNLAAELGRVLALGNATREV